MARPKKRTYADYLEGLVDREKRTFDEVRERIKRIKRLYRLTWKEIGDEIGCHENDIIRFVNTPGKTTSMGRVLKIDEFLDKYNEK